MVTVRQDPGMGVSDAGERGGGGGGSLVRQKLIGADEPFIFTAGQHSTHTSY